MRIERGIEIYRHFSKHLETMLPNQGPGVKERTGMWAKDVQQATQALLSRQRELHAFSRTQGVSIQTSEYSPPRLLAYPIFFKAVSL